MDHSVVVAIKEAEWPEIPIVGAVDLVVSEGQVEGVACPFLVSPLATGDEREFTSISTVPLLDVDFKKVGIESQGFVVTPDINSGRVIMACEVIQEILLPVI